MSKKYTPEQRSICRLVGTPVGNLGDMTPRAVAALKEADIIFAEDTRTAKSLLNYFDISKHVESYHKDNENTASDAILRAIEKGQRVAVISEAGMPGISDPGYVIIRKLMEAELPFEVVPGVSAGVHAAVASGLCHDGRYMFAGFLPAKGTVAAVENYSRLKCPVVFYESPHRIKDTVRLMFKYFKTPVAICRELTKIHEEVYWIYDESDVDNITVKGEFCIVAEGTWQDDDCALKADPEKIADLLVQDGVSSKTILNILKECGMKRNDAYRLVQEKCDRSE